ncbi:MAG: hypothetical protein JYX80_10910, partial [Candidatus Scalindua sediminis]|nr:hypothetical protein [Candidatus Scalindua sediminis]
AAEFKEVVLREAKIGGQIDMTGSKFNGKLDMASLEVESHLFMRGAAEFKEVVLREAKIGGQIDMTGSKFTGTLVMDSLEVESSLFMRDSAEFADIILFGAKVMGDLQMYTSKFTGELDMTLLQVGDNLDMKNAEIINSSPIRLAFAKIGGNLDLSGSTFKSFDLIGTRISREFRLSSKKTVDMPDIGDAEWDGVSKLTLHNTKVGVLQDSKESWPDNIELDGFTYDRLGKFFIFKDGGSVEATRDFKWLKEWLGKQKDYSPQPYEYLASVLQKSGLEGMAKDILYTSRERKRSEVVTGLNWCGLTILKYAIGYGYRIYYSILWIIFFIIAGMFCVWRNKEGRERGIIWSLFYSLDIILPIIRLDERHYEIELNGFAKYYFYFHIVIGFVLASFVIAGISGLTQ